jgi:chemotaxis protein methyltransferase CheR
VTELLITPSFYESLARILLEQAGLVLEDGKEYLIRSRLVPLLQRQKLSSFEELLQALVLSKDRSLLKAVIEAMVTTETSFFRDFHPFETLRKAILPGLISRRRETQTLNIWCAASASGQEPYSIAILLREYFPELLNWKILISATDISSEMLERSRCGRYSQLEVNRGLPAALLLSWFKQEGMEWQLDRRICEMVTFSQLNLTQPWPPMPMWDLVLIRNVMIYFESEAKRAILERVAHRLAKDGYLLLGGAETTFNLSDEFVRKEELKGGFYQLKDSF